MNQIKVIKGGALTTIQDAGRHHYQAYGVTVAGAMDDYAYRIANWLVGNSATDAVLEITLVGPTLQFNSDCIIAITGAELGALINGVPIANWCSHAIKANDIVSFSLAQQGCRAYLAVSGGIVGRPILGSRSTDLRAKLGVVGRALQQGDLLPIGASTYGSNIKTKLAAEKIPQYKDKHIINVIDGPQADHFSKAGIASFYNSIFRISSDSNRIGYRLEGPKIDTIGSSDIISDAIVFGSIQVANNGQPIIMMADRQTSGGYAKIATVISSDLSKLAQAKPSDEITFKCIDIETAQQKLKDYQQNLMRINADLTAQLKRAYGETIYYNISVKQRTYRVELQEIKRSK